MYKKIVVGTVAAGMLASALPVFAQTTAKPATDVTAKIACIGAAVNARESSLGSAITTFTAATNAAYSARASALKVAYTKTTGKEVKAEVKVAWNSFKNTMKEARKAWQSSRNSAWATFKKAAAACKAPAEVSDAANVTSESTGS